jgi:hypothetical protein
VLVAYVGSHLSEPRNNTRDSSGIIRSMQRQRLLSLTAQATLLALSVPASCVAQSSFDGTWKVDFQSAMPTKVNVWLLRDGIYTCTSCNPTIEVKTDGNDQPVKGQPFDTISITIVGPQTVREIEKKNGKIVSDETFTVSDDGETATDEFGNWKFILTRIAKAPAGTHELSGSWKPVKVESISDRELLVTYKLQGDTLTMSRPTGQSYTARFDGPEGTYVGDSQINSVALRRISRNIIEETDKANGKSVSVTRLTVGADGKAMTVSVRNLQDGGTNAFRMLKQ